MEVDFTPGPSRSDIILADFIISSKQWFSMNSPDQQHQHPLGSYRNANVQAPVQTYPMGNSGGGVQTAVFEQAPK